MRTCTRLHACAQVERAYAILRTVVRVGGDMFSFTRGVVSSEGRRKFIGIFFVDWSVDTDIQIFCGADSPVRSQRTQNALLSA